MTDSPAPLVDIGPLLDGDLEARGRVAVGIDAARCRVGFLAVGAVKEERTRP